MSCEPQARPPGRIKIRLPRTSTSSAIPAAELAVIEHRGPPADVDLAYGTLATYVTRHALAGGGPIREYYLIGQRDTADTCQWRTEIGWPIFRTASP